MENADPDTEGKIKALIEKLSGGTPMPEEMKQFIQKLPSGFALTTVLQPAEQGRLSVKMAAGDIQMPAGGDDDAKSKELEEKLKKMLSGVQLRAEITDSGAVASWWTEQKQANLVALFLELPDRPVKPGDTWSIGVRFLSMGNGFVCKKANRVNRVHLASTAALGDDRVATFEYVLSESVEGEFIHPMTKDVIPTTMRMSFVGTGEFLVRAGRWSRFSGRLSYKATGVQTGESEQNCALIPLDKVPPELLNLK